MIQARAPSIPGRYFSLRWARLKKRHLEGGKRATRLGSGLDFRRREVIEHDHQNFQKGEKIISPGTEDAGLGIVNLLHISASNVSFFH